MCMCGCVATLNHCPHHNCAMREEEQAVIQKAIAEGKGETAILQELTLRYGVQVLASPPAKGFNLAAWILPGLGLIVGFVLVVVVVRRWRKPSGKAPQPPAARTLDAKLLAAVEEEMKASGLGVRD
jgi:cytochrome c-type biogenesis protein CcmH